VVGWGAAAFSSEGPSPSVWLAQCVRLGARPANEMSLLSTRKRDDGSPWNEMCSNIYACAISAHRLTHNADVKGSRTIYSYQVAFRGRQAARGSKKQ